MCMSISRQKQFSLRLLLIGKLVQTEVHGQYSGFSSYLAVFISFDWWQKKRCLKLKVKLQESTNENKGGHYLHFILKISLPGCYKLARSNRVTGLFHIMGGDWGRVIKVAVSLSSAGRAFSCYGPRASLSLHIGSPQ